MSDIDGEREGGGEKEVELGSFRYRGFSICSIDSFFCLASPSLIFDDVVPCSSSCLTPHSTSISTRSHISKVKSLTLDTWTKEQIQSMKDMGNVKSNAIYNPDEMRNRPPTNMEESERDR